MENGTTYSFSYSDMDQVVNDSVRASGFIKNYHTKLTGSVMEKLKALADSGDAQGNMQAAYNTAKSESDRMDGVATTISDFGSSVSTLEEDAKSADNNVQTDIAISAKSYMGKRSLLQRAGDYIYKKFIAGNSALNFLHNVAASGGAIASKLIDRVRNSIKYKDGKYIWNIAKSVIGVGAAIVAFVGAAVAIVVAAPLTIVAAVAALVLVGIAFFNAYYTISSNSDALRAYKEGKLGKARHRGNVDSFSSYAERTDFGDAKANKTREKIGKAVDTAEVVCKVIVAINNIADLGRVKDEYGRIETVKNGKFSHAKFSKEAWKESFKSKLKSRDMAWTKEKGKIVGKENGISRVSEYLGFGSSDKIYYAPSTQETIFQQFGNLSSSDKMAKIVYDTIGVADTVVDKVEAVDKIVHHGSGITLGDGWKSVTDLLDTWKPLKGIEKIVSPVETVVEAVT